MVTKIDYKENPKWAPTTAWDNSTILGRLTELMGHEKILILFLWLCSVIHGTLARMTISLLSICIYTVLLFTWGIRTNCSYVDISIRLHTLCCAYEAEIMPIFSASNHIAFKKSISSFSLKWQSSLDFWNRALMTFWEWHKAIKWE